MRQLLLLLVLIVSSSCNSQNTSTDGSFTKKIDLQGTQIAEYVTSVFQDSKGHLWFGTLEKGIARYDGTQLRYFKSKDGLPADRVTGVIEDSQGILWFKTGNGLSKYDGNNFINYTIGDDFSANSISLLTIDSKGTFWIGTWDGVYIFNNQSFTAFPIPYPSITTEINPDTKNWITAIQEDSDGTMWFARDGYGLCSYDGTSFTHYLKKDGLHSNNITEIEFDPSGAIWVGSRVGEKDNPDPTIRTGSGGINLISDTIISFPDIKGFNSNDVYGIYLDPSDNIWISTISNGIYKYDGRTFKNYTIPISVMGMRYDRNDNLWLGGAGGLYRLLPNGEIVNITTSGPWPRIK